MGAVSSFLKVGLLVFNLRLRVCSLLRSPTFAQACEYTVGVGGAIGIRGLVWSVRKLALTPCITKKKRERYHIISPEFYIPQCQCPYGHMIRMIVHRNLCILRFSHIFVGFILAGWVKNCIGLHKHCDLISVAFRYLCMEGLRSPCSSNNWNHRNMPKMQCLEMWYCRIGFVW